MRIVAADASLQYKGCVVVHVLQYNMTLIQFGIQIMYSLLHINKQGSPLKFCMWVYCIGDTNLQETRRSQLGTGDRREMTTVTVLSLASTRGQRSQHLASR